MKINLITIAFLVSLIGTILALVFNFYNSWMGLLIGITIVLMIIDGYTQKNRELNDISKLMKKDVKNLEKWEKKEEKEYPRLFKVCKILVLAIPLIIIGYIFYSNFIASQEFSYYYDIGSEIDSSKPYLSPLNRISEADLNESYRNLTSSLVYFNAVIPRGSDSIIVQTKLKNLPENSSILLGAQNKEIWSYSYKQIHNSLLESLNLTGNITKLKSNLQDINSMDDIPSGSIIATNLDIKPVENLGNYTISDSEFNYSLRESHTFYVYLNNSLKLYVEKKDINWYDGEDTLNITLYNLNGDILGNSSISDDGSINKSKINNIITSGSLNVDNLSTGVYKLEFKGGSDTTITKIKINTNKIVTNRIFSADSVNYGSLEDNKITVYTNASKHSFVSFQTYHTPYLQSILINNKNYEIKNVSTPLKVEFTPKEYIIVSTKSNVIISSTNYLAFSKENYFEPFTYTIVSIPSKQEDLANIDYIITDYVPTEKSGDWIITNTTFNIKDLYISNDKLSLLFNTPSLGENQNATNTNYVSVDEINITIQKNGWKI